MKNVKKNNTLAQRVVAPAQPAATQPATQPVVTQAPAQPAATQPATQPVVTQAPAQPVVTQAPAQPVVSNLRKEYDLYLKELEIQCDLRKKQIDGVVEIGKKFLEATTIITVVGIIFGKK